MVTYHLVSSERRTAQNLTFSIKGEVRTNLELDGTLNGIVTFLLESISKAASIHFANFYFYNCCAESS